MNRNPLGEECSMCIYWRRSHRTAIDGLCRKNAPTASPENGNAVWPRSTEGAWCGSFVFGVETE